MATFRYILLVKTLAIKRVFNILVIGPEDRYIAKVQEVSRRQLALAGYRLGDLLKVA